MNGYKIQKNRINIRALEESTQKPNSLDIDSCSQQVVGADNANEYKKNSYKCATTVSVVK